MKTIIRVKKRPASFATIDKTSMKDKRLSLAAKGLHVWLLAKPDDWRANCDNIAKETSDSARTVRRVMAELERVGYVRRTFARARATGRIIGCETIVFETVDAALVAPECQPSLFSVPIQKKRETAIPAKYTSCQNSGDCDPVTRSDRQTGSPSDGFCPLTNNELELRMSKTNNDDHGPIARRTPPVIDGAVPESSSLSSHFSGIDPSERSAEIAAAVDPSAREQGAAGPGCGSQLVLRASASGSEASNHLISQGFDSAEARTLIEGFTSERVIRNVRYVEGLTSPVRNRLGYIREAIRKDYAAGSPEPPGESQRPERGGLGRGSAANRTRQRVEEILSGGSP